MRSLLLVLAVSFVGTGCAHRYRAEREALNDLETMIPVPVAIEEDVSFVDSKDAAKIRLRFTNKADYTFETISINECYLIYASCEEGPSKPLSDPIKPIGYKMAPFRLAPGDKFSLEFKFPSTPAKKGQCRVVTYKYDFKELGKGGASSMRSRSLEPREGGR